MRIANLIFTAIVNNKTRLFFTLEGLENIDSMKKDGVPWDSMVGVRAIGN